MQAIGGSRRVMKAGSGSTAIGTETEAALITITAGIATATAGTLSDIVNTKSTNAAGVSDCS